MAGDLPQLEAAELRHVLALLLQLLQLPGSGKLSRNAATCCNRLAGCPQLAAVLATHHPGWTEALCSCFASAGGMQQRAQQGGDLSTAQFLLVAICQLASAAAAGEQAGSEGGMRLLTQLLSQPAAAARAALDSAAAAAPGSEQQRNHMEQAAMQVETIAVALEASSKQGGGSPLAPSLPSLLSHFGGTLQQAAAAAAAAAAATPADEPVLLQAVCRLAAAASATPAAGMGLELLQRFVAAPQHPCVLNTLAQLVCNAGQLAAHPQHLQAAVSQATQAAAARHGDDPEWQPALLRLGEACLQRLPAVVAEGATLDALLAAAQHSMRSYHREACEQVVQFAEALCCLGCKRRAAAGRNGSLAAGDAAPPAAQHVQQRLDGGGLGAALVLGLLLAAAGSMPPYMVVQIADALHRTWQAVGDDR